MRPIIRELLYKIWQSGEPVKFFNTFYGMPVSFNGTIENVSDNRVTFKIPKVQIYCVFTSGSTHISNPLLPGAVRAQFVSMDWERETVDLYDFHFTPSLIGKRSYVRVELDQPMRGTATVHLTEGQKILPIRLVEISLHGGVMSVERSFVKAGYFDRDTQIGIMYNLVFPRNEYPETVVSYEGTVKHVLAVRDSDFLYRIGVQTYPNQEIEVAITKYLALRQKDLLNRLRNLASKAY
jgi:hypothetical protein